MTTRPYQIILVTALTMFVGGCSTPFQRGKVYREWSTSMSQMGIFPVYPPREDIVVGDVYAIPLHPYDSATVEYIGGLGTAGIHVSYLGDPNLEWANLLTVSSNYYQARPYPADTTEGLPVGTNGLLPLIPIASYSNSPPSHVFAGGSLARLRQVAFPDFSVTTIDQSSLSAVVPIEAIMASFNFTHSDIRAVHFKMPQAESYGLSTEALLKDVYNSTNFVQTADGTIYTRGDKEAVISVPGAQMAYSMFADIMETLMNDPTSPVFSNIMIRDHLQKTAKKMKDKIYLALISEIYFTRSMDITIERKKATGASASARPVSASEMQQLKDLGLTKLNTRTNMTTTTTSSSTATSTNIQVGTKAEMIQLSEGDTAYDLAKKIRELETPDGVSNVGGAVKVLHVSASNIGLRRTFARPIVVGVRGVLLKIDVNHPVIFADDTNKPPTQWMRVESFGTTNTVKVR